MLKEHFQRKRLDVLAKKMKRGDARAADAIYRELAEKVFGFCMTRVRSRHTAEDLTQEIFMKLVVGIKTFDPSRGTFVVWFWSLARNAILDHYRKPADVSFADMGESDDAERVEMLAVHDPQGDVERRFARGQLERFLETLTPGEKELFELRFIADLPYGEISRILEKPEGGLRVAVSRLKKKIQSALTT